MTLNVNYNVNIVFDSKKLLRCANDDAKCLKELGERRAKIFKRRLSELRSADTLEDVRFLPGHYHELVGDRKGQWTCDLDQPFRLVFAPQEEPIPKDGLGSYEWREIKGIRIIEIVNYHGK